jgi:dTDP-4-amino-4,6-dideoxygalactose transaminase
VKEIPYREFPVTQEVRDAVVNALERGQDGWHTGGKEEIAFEKEFSEYVGTKYAVAVTSGAGALHIALALLDIGPGDEVITAANAFTAAADCALWVGAKPVFVDIDREIFNMDPDQIEQAITSRTKAIVPVHMYGHPADMDPIMEIAEKHRLWVVEDVAQAAGSKYKGRKTGSIGHMGVYSFASKNMSCYGEGGMITTNSKEYREKAIMYRHFGHRPTGFGEEQYVLGYNYTLGGWGFALGRISLKHLDEWNRKRRENAKTYNELLDRTPGVEIPTERGWAYHAYLHYVIRVKRRDRLKKYLATKGVQTIVHYPIPIHLQMPYKERYGYEEGAYPLSEEACQNILSLPPGFHLSEKEVRYIAECIKEFCCENRS